MVHGIRAFSQDEVIFPSASRESIISRAQYCHQLCALLSANWNSEDMTTDLKCDTIRALTSFNVDFFEGEMVGFDENLAVGSCLRDVMCHNV